MPHEVDMTRALIMSLRAWWEEQPERRSVARVVLQVGRFTGVEPALLHTSFARQKQGTFLAYAELEICETPLIAHCRPCGQDYSPELGLRYCCPGCAGPMEEIRSGRELRIERVDWAN